MPGRVIMVASALLLATASGSIGAARPGDETGGAGPFSTSRYAALALECVHQEYPNQIAHVMQGDADVRPPRKLTPTFYGCYDWHSAVHGHWLLARLARLHPGAGFAPAARKALAASFTKRKIAGEAAYLSGEGRAHFERPYGMAWLLQLAAELREWEDPEAAAWSRNLAPLEQAVRERLYQWIPKLTYPIRTGEHSQTAFAFGLILDWAQNAGDRELDSILTAKIHELHDGDRDCPLSYEPGGQDFLSPCLAEADLMRRVMEPAEYARWLDGFLPGIPEVGGAGWLPPALVSDRSDGKLAHLDGLNISRAWMLEGILSGLPPDDPRRSVLEAAAAANRKAGLEAVTGEQYAGGHWLGSFATYLVTARGVRGAP